MTTISVPLVRPSPSPSHSDSKGCDNAGPSARSPGATLRPFWYARIVAFNALISYANALHTYSRSSSNMYGWFVTRKLKLRNTTRKIVCCTG